mgnify:FL=1|jgi:hypothetical protein
MLLFLLLACGRSSLPQLTNTSLSVRLDTHGDRGDRVIVEFRGDPPDTCKDLVLRARIDGVDLGNDEGPDRHDEGSPDYCTFDRWAADRSILLGGPTDRTVRISDSINEATAVIPSPFPKRHLLPDTALTAITAGMFPAPGCSRCGAS